MYSSANQVFQLHSHSQATFFLLDATYSGARICLERRFRVSPARRQQSTWEVPCPCLPKAQTWLALNEKPQGIRWQGIHWQGIRWELFTRLQNVLLGRTSAL